LKCGELSPVMERSYGKTGNDRGEPQFASAPLAKVAAELYSRPARKISHAELETAPGVPEVRRTAWGITWRNAPTDFGCMWKVDARPRASRRNGRAKKGVLVTEIRSTSFCR